MKKINIKENPFISKQNINLLWEVLLDEPTIKHITQEEITQLHIVFSNNVSIFNENTKHTNNPDLTQLNKTFLGQMIRMIRANATTNAYKVEDIQAQRQQQFEHQLAQKRNDFESSMTLTKPPLPNFTEKIEDEKIKGMDELIAKTVAQRNFDISQINMNPTNTDWLNPQQTSIKIKIQEDISNSTPIEIVELPKTNSKKLSWNDNKNETKVFDKNEAIINNNTPINRAPLIETNFSILNKLKKVADHPSLSILPIEAPSKNDDYAELKEKMNTLELKMDTILDSINKLFEIVNKKEQPM